MDNRESYVDKIVDRGLEKPKCVKSGKFIYTLYMAKILEKLEMPTGCTQQNRKLSTRLSTDCG